MSAQSEVDHQKTKLELITREIRKIEEEELTVSALHEKMRRELEDDQREMEREMQKKKAKLKDTLDRKFDLASDKARKLKEQKEREEMLRKAEESLRKETEAKNSK